MGTEASDDPCHRSKGRLSSDKTPAGGPGYKPGRYGTTSFWKARVWKAWTAAEACPHPYFVFCFPWASVTQEG